MRNQQRWFLSLLGLGILVFTQTTADSYDVARLARDIANGDVSNVNAEGCWEQFYNKMTNAKNNYAQNESGTGLSNINEITQSLLICILTGRLDTGKPEQNPDASGDEEVPDSQHRSANCRTGRMRSGTSKSRNAASQSRRAIDQIDDFECQPNYADLSEQLVEQLRKELGKFLQTGLDQEYRQKNYANLVKKLLHAVTVTILSDDLISGVSAAVDKRLEPYILEMKEIQLSDASTDKSKIGKFENGRRSATTDCVSDELEPTIECIYKYVVRLVELERLLTRDPNGNQIWELWGGKLLHDLERLLKVIERSQPERRGYLERDMAPMRMVYGARSLVISCLDMIRENYDAKSRRGRIVISGAEIREALSVCDASNRLANDLMDYLIAYIGVGDIDPSFIDSLKKNIIEELLINATRFYPDQKHLESFVQTKLKQGILINKFEYENHYAWDLVRQWHESSINDVELRFLKLFAYDEGLQKVNCDLNDVDSVSGDWLVSEECNRYHLEDLVIMASALCKDGLSMQAIFYEYPILSNYMYIVDKVLSAEVPSCKPIVKKSLTIPLVALGSTV